MHTKYHSSIVFLLVLLCSNMFIYMACSNEKIDLDCKFWVPKDPPRAYYRFDCDLDPNARIMRGNGTIRITNHTNNPICRLAIDWAINEYQSIEVQSNGKPARILEDSEENLSSPPICFELPERLSPGEELELTLSFSMTDSIPFMSGLSVPPERIAIRKFLPTLWWGIPTHDDYDVKIEVPSEYAIGPSGRLNKETGYYHGESVRSFGLFIGKEHRVLEADAGETLIRCFCNDKSYDSARLIMETAVDVINFYRDYFGFYPYKVLNIVPGSVIWWGGFNVATSIAAIHGMERFSEQNESEWRTITVHEICHMYWGEYVMEKDFPDWLWLGLGIYTQREYARSKSPGPNNPYGYLSTYAQGVKNYYDTTIDIPPHYYEAIKFNFNSVVKHGKGYSVISALDCLLGHETFDRIVQRCLKEYAGHQLGAFEFQKVCEEESRQDLGWFFDQWVRSNKYLSYKVSSQECNKNNDRYVSKVGVDRLGTLKMPVPVMACFEDGSSQLQFTDRLLDKNILLFESTSPLKEVILDPDTTLALVIPPLSDNYDMLVDVINDIQSLSWTGEGEKALIAYKKAKEADLRNAEFWFKLGMTLYDGNYYEEALEAFEYLLEFLEPSDKEYRFGSFLSFVWKGHLFDLLGRREEALHCYKEALDRYPGHEISHDQYKMKINKKWLEERLKEPFKR